MMIRKLQVEEVLDHISDYGSTFPAVHLRLGCPQITLLQDDFFVAKDVWDDGKRFDTDGFLEDIFIHIIANSCQLAQFYNRERLYSAILRVENDDKPFIQGVLNHLTNKNNLDTRKTNKISFVYKGIADLSIELTFSSETILERFIVLMLELSEKIERASNLSILPAKGAEKIDISSETPRD